MNEDFNILIGDAKKKLRQFPDNCFDSCVMDGPYGLRFMGKTWDTFDINKKGAQRDSYPVGEKRLQKGRNTAGFGLSIEAGKYNQSLEANRNFQNWFCELATEIFRVLKPGAFFLSFGGTRTYHRMICGIEDAGFEIRDCMQWVFGSGFPKSHNLEDDWEGFGTALKPAWEPICMARKPLEKGLTVSQNVKKWGTGVLNINACRVDGEGGRWPANLIHDGSDEVLALFPAAKGQQAKVRGTEPTKNGFSGDVTFGGQIARVASAEPRVDTSASASRFFYCAKTSKADRNEGLELFLKELTSDGREKPIDNPFQRGQTLRKNSHPTVKPTKLMRYLVVLVTPPGGEVLDPCCGSGSTGKAAILDGYRFTGIDQEQKWVDTSIARCTHATKVRQKLLRAGKQLSL